MHKTDTIAAIATGLNSSGIGIIRISGADAFSIASLIFKTKSGKKISEFESHKAYYGFIFDGEKEIDEVLLLTYKGPKSFTTEDSVEINCHGGILVIQKILEVVLKNGARPAENGEFTKRAFLGGRIDLSEAEAVIDLISSKNDYSLENSLKHLKGGLSEKINEFREKILHETAFIEAALDDPEHYSLDDYGIEILLPIVEELEVNINKLINTFSDGSVIKEGIDTVILGKPNVGKSSLLNYLVGKERAIVTDIAGTTRDTLTENISLNGINLNISDTAGIRETDDTVEKIGVLKAYEYAKDADFIIMVVDSSVPLNDEDKEIFKFIEDKKAVVLINKTDLSKGFDFELIDELTDKKVIYVSVKENEGLNELSEYIKSEFLSGNIDSNDDILITNIRHKDLLKEALDSLCNVKDSINGYMPEDLFTIDLLNAYECLSKIVGQSVEEDVVNEVFSKFCMGK